MDKQKTIIGRTTVVSLVAEDKLKIPAKVDTGADGSSIWASELHMDETGHLSFCLFAKGSKYYTGKRHTTKSYAVKAVRSAHGTLQVRYKVDLVVQIEGKRVKGTVTLADRSQNTYPMLIGCRLLNNKFIVDVAKGKRTSMDDAKELSKERYLTKELKENPVSFFKKYHLDNHRGDIKL